MSSIIKVDTVQDQDGNNIINENANTITIGASGDTITIPSGATFDSSAATNTLPATVVTTTGTQTLTNKSIVASQLTGTVATSNLGTGTADATTFLRGDQTYAAAGGGKVLQVVSVTWKDAFSSTVSNGTFAAITGASASITPSATTSKILVTTMLNTSGSVYGQYIRLLRGGSTIAGALGTVTGSRTAITGYAGTPNDAAEMDTCHINYLDSPSSTSAVTYTLDGSARAATTWTVNYPYEDGDYDYHGHSVSTITLMEIGA